MEKRTAGIVATVVTVLLCGCPGLIALCMGPLMALVALVPGADIDIFGSNDPSSAMTMGAILLCSGIIFIAIPVVVGVTMLRKKKDAVPAPLAYTPPPAPVVEPAVPSKPVEAQPAGSIPSAWPQEPYTPPPAPISEPPVSYEPPPAETIPPAWPAEPAAPEAPAEPAAPEAPGESEEPIPPTS